MRWEGSREVVRAAMEHEADDTTRMLTLRIRTDRTTFPLDTGYMVDIVLFL